MLFFPTVTCLIPTTDTKPVDQVFLPPHATLTLRMLPFHPTCLLVTFVFWEMLKPVNCPSSCMFEGFKGQVGGAKAGRYTQDLFPIVLQNSDFKKLIFFFYYICDIQNKNILMFITQPE